MGAGEGRHGQAGGGEAETSGTEATEGRRRGEASRGGEGETSSEAREGDRRDAEDGGRLPG